MKVVVTGATGFLGSELLRNLLLRPDIEEIYLLIRPAKNESAEEKFKRLIQSYWQKFKPLPETYFSRIKIVAFDLGIRRTCTQIEDAEYFFHCAANTDLSLPLNAARCANLYTTLNALQLAKAMKHLRCFTHLSTAFVSGKQKGNVEEAQAPEAFFNFYEQSKKEAEDAVKFSDLPYLILRPSIVVGDSRDGYVLGFKIIYSILRIWLSERLARAPIDPKAKVDIVPVDFVVNSILSLCLDLNLTYRTLHLCAGKNAPTTLEIFNHFVRVFDLPKPKLASPRVLNFLRLPVIYPFIGHSLQTLLQYAHWHFPYFGHRSRVFATTQTTQLLKTLPGECPLLDTYGENLFSFCKNSKWGKVPLY